MHQTFDFEVTFVKEAPSELKLPCCCLCTFSSEYSSLQEIANDARVCKEIKKCMPRQRKKNGKIFIFLKWFVTVYCKQNNVIFIKDSRLVNVFSSYKQNNLFYLQRRQSFFKWFIHNGVWDYLKYYLRTIKQKRELAHQEQTRLLAIKLPLVLVNLIIQFKGLPVFKIHTVIGRTKKLKLLLNQITNKSVFHKKYIQTRLHRTKTSVEVFRSVQW